MELAYEELVDFIASETRPGSIAAFRPSEDSKARVTELLTRKKQGGLSSAEQSELEHYLQLEHLMRLAKARAQRYAANK